MSKKKAFSGSTMTLKDFHGGSIPSDLPLPSAPGVVVRPSDRSGFDRQIPNAWGNRSDHRSRPGSSGANRSYDDKSSFFSHPAHIGRNFDEDERTPLDGVSIPRRTVSDESINGLPTRYEPKSADSIAGRFSGLGVSSSTVSQSQTVNNANPARFSGPNAWGMRKEVVSVVEPVHTSTWSGPNAMSRFAQASALEKVSSGRWQSKPPPVLHQADVEVITYSDDIDFSSNRVYYNNNSYSGMDPTSERGGFERGRCVENSRVVEDEAKERYLAYNRDGVRPASAEGKFGVTPMPNPISAEAVERPKIKLLPRSKPLETSELLAVDYKQAYQPPPNPARVDASNETYENEVLSKPGSAGSESGKRAVERRRLTLKPRSQAVEQSEAIAERERKSLFGGARPRELVLKERGVDDVVINNLDVVQSPNRVKHEHPKTETRQEPVISNPVYGDRSENYQNNDQKIGKNFERRDHRAADHDKTEQGRSRRNENWRNNREPERQPQQQERRPEPENWRKPVEQQPNSPPPGMRFGKASSALELARAFSRSNSSGPKTLESVSGHRGLPNQIPFSRLTDTRPRRQIGY